MIEVFKTDVTESSEAQRLVGLIHADFQGHQANFDLDDCDNILRVQNNAGEIDPVFLIQFIKRHGFNAEVLP